MRGAARPLVGERRVSASVDSLQLRRKSYTYRMTAGTAAGAGAAVAGEGAQASPVATRAYFALKIIELVFGILNVGLVVDPFRVIPETDVVHACLALVAFSSVIIVSCVLLISRLAREPVPVRATLLFLLVNGCLLVAAGGVVLADWCRMYYRIYNLQPKLYLDMMIASGIIAIFNAAAHFVDVGLTCLASLCLGLGLDAFMNGAVPQWPGVGLCCILTGAYVIITGVAIGCSLFANPLPKSLSVTLSAVGGLLFAATAANVLRGWEAAAAAGGPGAATVRYATGLRQMRAQGLLALGAAAAFLMDAAHEGVVGPWLQCEPGSSPGARASLALPLPPASRAVSGTGLSRAPSGHLPLQARGSVFRDLSAATAGAGAAPFARPVPPVSAASFATSFGRAVSAVSQRLPPVSAAAAAARRFHRMREARDNSVINRFSAPRPSLMGYDKI